MHRIYALSLALAILVVSAISASAQSSCSCTLGNGGCTVNQSCPSGYIAICTCSASGCSGQCNKDEVPPEGPPENRSPVKLDTADPSNIGEILSRSSGLKIRFQPSPGVDKLGLSGHTVKYPEYWNLLDILSDKGTVTINGQPLDVWKGWRTTLLAGGEFQMCAGSAPVRMLVHQIGFIVGRNFVITAGDPSTKVSGQIGGNSLREVIDSLSLKASIKIAEQ